jgi:hypothetical protein
MAITAAQLSELTGLLGFVKGFLPAADAKYVDDIIVDTPEIVAAYTAVKAAIPAFPKPFTAVGFVSALGPALAPIAALVDSLLTQFKAAKATPSA